MQKFFVNQLWIVFSRVNLLWGASLITYVFDFAQCHEGVKTKFCPTVVELCPVFVPIVSIFGQILSRFGLIRVGTIRTSSNGFGGKPVKTDGDSGVSASPVRCIPVLAHLPRARARLGQPYDSRGAYQVQSVQSWKESWCAKDQRRCRGRNQAGRIKNASVSKSDGRIYPLREDVSFGRRSRSVSAQLFS